MQSQSQLKAIYKDSADTIVGNCDTTLFLGGKETTTLREMSEMLGKETIDITFVLCYELITMVTERNNMHDLDTWMFFKWGFKALVAVYLVTNTFNIVMAVFDVGRHLVSSASGGIGGSTSIDIASTISTMETEMETMEIGELLALTLETALVSLCMKIISILITVVLYGRMIEIYLYSSIAPVPFATMTNREWGQIGNNYKHILMFPQKSTR